MDCTPRIDPMSARENPTSGRHCPNHAPYRLERPRIPAYGEAENRVRTFCNTV